VVLPVFKTGLAANTVAGGFDSLPPPPLSLQIGRQGNMACSQTLEEKSPGTFRRR
jgi:hypothetical protein